MKKIYKFLWWFILISSVTHIVVFANNRKILSEGTHVCVTLGNFFLFITNLCIKRYLKSKGRL